MNGEHDDPMNRSMTTGADDDAAAITFDCKHMQKLANIISKQSEGRGFAPVFFTS